MNRVVVFANENFVAPASYQTGKFLSPVTRSNCSKKQNKIVKPICSSSILSVIVFG